MSFRRRSRRCTAIALAALGLAVPVAQARLVDPPLGHTASAKEQALAQERSYRSEGLTSAQIRHYGIVLHRNGASTAPAVTPALKVQTTGSGIDWGSLALGAAGFSAIVAAFAGANAVVVRRRRVQAVR